MHKSKLRRITLAVCFALMPFTADAAGLGKLTVISGLGEPLNAEIDLLSTTPEELSTLTADIAPEEAYAVQGLERSALHNSIEIEVSKKPDGTPILKLSTRQPISDPFLDMLVQVDWATGRLLREYTILLDPPGYSNKAVTGGNAVNAPTAQGKAEESSAEAEANTPAQPADSSGELPPATEQAESATEHTTVPGDTLNSIARELQVEDVSLEQMLVGLYNANEDAFVNGNMNRLKVGQIIRAPSLDELQSVSRSEAAQQIRVHTENWNAYRNQLAGIVADAEPGAEDVDAQTDAGKITTATEDRAAPPAAGPRDVVKLSKSDTGPASAGDSKALQDRINALQEEVTAKEKATQEADERTAMLEKQIADMQKLLAIKNEALAEMQNNAAGTSAPVGTTQPAMPAETTPAQPAADAGKPEAQPSAEAAKPDAAAPAAQAPAPAAETKPADVPKKKAVPPPPIVADEPGLLDGLIEDPMLLAAGGGLVVLGGGWLFLRNRRRRNLDSFEQGILTAGGLKANTVFGNTAGGTVDTGDTSFLTDFSQSGGGMIDTHDVDPIAEAEVYMAYGRDAQAEEILKDAIAKEPKRYELHLKLLEILANRKDTAAFETIAGELYSTLGTNDPTWAKVADMGKQLEPGNPLYDTKATGAAMAAAAVAGVVATGAAAEKSKLDASDFENAEELSESSLDFSLGGEIKAPAIGNPAATNDEKAVATPGMASGLDFDLGEKAESSTSEKPLSEMTTMSDSIFGAKEETPAETANEPDFDLNKQEQLADEMVGLNDFGNTMPGLNLSEESAEEQLPELQLGTGNGQNVEADAGLNFEMPELGAAENEPASAAAEKEEFPQFNETVMLELPAEQEESKSEAGSFDLPDLGAPTISEFEEKPEVTSGAGNGLDFNFDTSFEASEAAAEPAVEEEAPNPPEIDLSGISLDFGPTIDNPEVGNESQTAESDVSAGESADVETKLDLVTAYMEMGDKEGARELLDEVLKEGGPQQKQRAQEMLNGLS